MPETLGPLITQAREMQGRQAKTSRKQSTKQRQHNVGNVKRKLP
jgi:hypothetical protein